MAAHLKDDAAQGKPAALPAGRRRTLAVDGLDDADIAHLCGHAADRLVGASARAERPSNGVMRFCSRRGWTVTPVNPGLAGQTLHGQTVVATLDEAGPLDMVDIFRASEQAGAVVDEAVRLGARSVWLQLGVIDQAAAARARAAGVTAVMDRCPAIEAPRLRAWPTPS